MQDEQQTQSGRNSTPRYKSNREALDAYEEKLNEQGYQ
jgi:hypothetical protein